MIETRRYSAPEEFDKQSIWDKEFYQRRERMEKEGKIKHPYLHIGEYSPQPHYIAPGLMAIIRNDTFPVIAYGSPEHFKEGESILEELLGTKLTGETL
ncbi:hypothetical protein HN832_05140 [archaeon]|jgi:hypothetical protein|nr:hypothetical protein [archaeon]MBT4373751.1 hypothetical protein [archaeon]MBT4532217.1 hypothetical protein [archaeon]MBT7001441.1 hypothetical protein [archaeon]MBT7282769.1 hypothetical protein [archaeon]